MQNSKFLFSTLIASGFVLSLTGCGSDDNDTITLPEVPERMVAIYAPSSGSLPVPNDLLFLGSEDLTLNIPVADPTNFSDPQVAINTLDGWSAFAPFPIEFSDLGTGLTLAPESVVAGEGVRIFQVNVARPEIAPGIIAPTGPVTSVVRELAANQEYAVQVTGSESIAVVPLAPLEQQGAYMVVLTDALRDNAGNPISGDSQYIITKSQTEISPTSSVAGLEPVRQLVNAMESAADAAGIPRESIILSYQFTVQSVGAATQTAKLALIDAPIAQGVMPMTGFSSLMTDTTPFTGVGAADLYKGSIALNYLLGTPSLDNPTAPLNTPWRAAEQLPLGPNGELVPNPFGENLSYANTLPRVNGVEVAPLLVSLPKAALCPKPASGYPVTLFQHGITSDRTSALGLMDSQAAPPTCRAVISMDQPLHGITEDDPVHLALQAASGGATGIFEGFVPGGLRERTFGVDFINNDTSAPGSDGNVDTSGAHTINLANLLVARDNLRQASFDLLQLQSAVPFMDVDGGGADFDATDVTFIGHSLGGIVGSNFVAYSNQLQAAALANPGSGIVGLLDASLTFGDTIRQGVASAAGITTMDPEFAATYAAFLFAAQTVIDKADPANTAAFALVNNVPTLLLQVLNDPVIPNSAPLAPLSGTEPMGRVLALTVTPNTAPGQVVGDRLFTKLNTGGHATLLTPAGPMGSADFLTVTTEMQTQIASFFASGGAAILITDPSLLDE
ncbi:MAG: hypothetical protein AAGJ37_10560 [Pseudomonadota bacterium]